MEDGREVEVHCSSDEGLRRDRLELPWAEEETLERVSGRSIVVEKRSTLSGY